MKALVNAREQAILKRIVYKTLPLSLIEIDSEQVRKLDPEHLQEVMNSMRDLNLQLAPILVYRVGWVNGRTAKYRLIDGQHRFTAAQILGWSTINAGCIEEPISTEEAIALQRHVQDLSRAHGDYHILRQIQKVLAATDGDMDRAYRAMATRHMSKAQFHKRVRMLDVGLDTMGKSTGRGGGRT